MSDRPITPAEYFAVLNAPARRNPERSWAQPQERYRDPAQGAKFEREKEAKINRCNSAISLVGCGMVGGSSFGAAMNLAETAVVEAAPERESPFNVVMGIWARWMRLSDQQHPGGDGNLQDTRDFMRTAEAVNVMVDDLPRVSWWAVKKSQGICTVWRFPDSSYADALQDAEQALVPKMQNHIAVRRYFN